MQTGVLNILLSVVSILISCFSVGVVHVRLSLTWCVVHPTLLFNVSGCTSRSWRSAALNSSHNRSLKPIDSDSLPLKHPLNCRLELTAL